MVVETNLEGNSLMSSVAMTYILYGCQIVKADIARSKF